MNSKLTHLNPNVYSSPGTSNNTVIHNEKPSTSSSLNTNQFKHTLLWNNIISHLKTTIIQNHQKQVSIKKQRFVTSGVGGMLLIKQTLISSSKPATISESSSNQSLETLVDNISFSGSQCVDIIYNYLTGNANSYKFERQVTRDKVIKLCQIMIDSSIIQSVQNTTRFDDSSVKFYKLISNSDSNNILSGIPSSTPTKSDQLKDYSNDKENKFVPKKLIPDQNPDKQLNSSSLTKSLSNNNDINSNIIGSASASSSNTILNGILYSKAKLINKTNNVNTKLKRKLTSMKRSNTIHSLYNNDSNESSDDLSSKTSQTSPNGIKQSVSISSTIYTVDENKPICSITPSTSRLAYRDSPILSSRSSSRSKHSDTSKKSSKSSSDLRSSNCQKYSKLAQDLLLTRQITRELIIEKLLSLIDLPIIEHLLLIDERNDSEYCEAIDRFNNLVLGNSGTDANPSSSGYSLSEQNNTDSTEVKSDSNSLLSISSLNLIQRSLSILNQTYDVSKCDHKDEWRKSALDCLEFIDHERIQKHLNSKTYDTIKLDDIELYNLIKDYYHYKNKFIPSKSNNFFFDDDSFQPLFTNILVFIRKSHYNKALEILNLGTLLLLKQTQAEFKRLLKFLYLTANSSHSPRLSDTHPNNSIILNHFSFCLINTKLIGYEETRLLLNFMLNNFDHLFKLNTSIKESIEKRKLLMQKYGQEEALIEKSFCKRLSNNDYKNNSKEQTTKALVDLINHIIDDPKITLKQKKLKLKALQRIHPEVYDKYFSDLF